MNEVKIKVTFTEGYEKRFTRACLEVLSVTRAELFGGIGAVKKEVIASEGEGRECT